MLRRFLTFDKIFFRFIAVGIINTFLGGILIFSLYNSAGMGYWLSSGIACIAVTIISFFLNKYFTFAVNEWRLFIVVAFLLNIAICYIFAYGIAKPMISYFFRQSSMITFDNISLITGTCLFSGMNYLGQRFVVFKKTGDKK